MEANTTTAVKDAGKQVQAFSIIKHFEKIIEVTKDKKLSEESLMNCDAHLTIAAERLSLTKAQTLLLAVFTDQCDDQSLRICDLARHFDCRNINIMCYSDDIQTLVDKGYIRKRIERRQTLYRVPEDVIAALKKNTAYTPPVLEGLTMQQLFNELCRLFGEAEERDITFEELTEQTNDLIENNSHLSIAKEIKEKYCCLEDEDITLLLFFCHKLVNEDDDSVMFYDLERIYDSKADFNSMKNDFKRGWNNLLTCKLVESKKNDDLVSRDCFCLTESAKKELLSELNLNIKEQAKPRNIILAKDIVEKPLYYNSREQSQIDQLASLLDAENFAKVQKRLVRNKMRKGFACLFYGSPGTGKTETVNQIGRRTGRDIMYVNVSEIKSMWVGESEKNIKSLFDRYRNFCKQSENVPILLFNEADAVLGIRQESAERAVDKMENSIQNIILQEMETLDGIMIATTNLTQNLDPAFERRFLFKIEFDKPGLEAKTAIWRSMIPELPESAATELASSYNFSGGQIENIARKRTVDQIIRGKRPDLAMIHGYCKSEQINNNRHKERRPIGY